MLEGILDYYLRASFWPNYILFHVKPIVCPPLIGRRDGLVVGSGDFGDFRTVIQFKAVRQIKYKLTVSDAPAFNHNG